MALTYDQHKAAVDDAYPTPPIEWERQDDHLNYSQHEVASARMLFNGQTHLYLGSHWQLDVDREMGYQPSCGQDERKPVISGEVSWDDAKSAFEPRWEAHCEAQRALLAVHRPMARTWSTTSPATFQ